MIKRAAQSGENPAARCAIVIDADSSSPAPGHRTDPAMARASTATYIRRQLCIDRPINRLSKSPANAHHIVPSTKMHSPIRIGICRPSRPDNGPTINCPTANIARKTVMVEVTAALDTRRSAAIVGSEGRKMFVDRIPAAANAQITALHAVTVRCPGFVEGALLENDFNAHGCQCPVLIVKRSGECRPPALPRLSGRTPGILSNCLLSVVLGTSEAVWTVSARRAVEARRRPRGNRIRRLCRMTILDALSRPAALHTRPRA